MLERIVLSGFQSYASPQAVDVDPHITLLTGLNNVGKSALLRALQVHSAPQEGVAPGFELTQRWIVPEDVFKRALSHFDGNRPHPIEWIGSGGFPTRLEASWAFGGSVGSTQPQNLQCSGLALPDLGARCSGDLGRAPGWDSGPYARTSTMSDELTNIARAAATNIAYLGPRQIDLGARTLSGSDKLAPDARNLSEVLLLISQNHRHEVFEPLEEFLRSAFPGVRSMTIGLTTSSGSSQTMGEPMINYQHLASPVPLRLCGTGVEQMLALAVAVIFSDHPRLVLIDEPQAYLHPHAERSMLALLADHPQHQFVIATHSHTLLRAQALTQTRLLAIRDGETQVTRVESQREILDELGVTAADLWLADRVIWVEGPSEESALGLIAAEILSEPDLSTLAIRRMPDASRFAARSPRRAEAAFRFCAEVAKAIAPLDVDMRFVFDADEKTDDFKERIQAVSGDRATFLPVRELENLFLDPALLHSALADLCESTQQSPPSLESVKEDLAAALGEHADRELYPYGLRDGDEPRNVVRASELLRRMWWKRALAAYDKVLDGERFTRHALRDHRALLDPLIELLQPLDAG